MEKDVSAEADRNRISKYWFGEFAQNIRSSIADRSDAQRTDVI